VLTMLLAQEEFLQNYKTVQLVSKEAFDELYNTAPPPVPAKQTVPPPPPLPSAANISGPLSQSVTSLIAYYYAIAGHSDPVVSTSDCSVRGPRIGSDSALFPPWDGKMSISFMAE